jgi:hypothetical protein
LERHDVLSEVDECRIADAKTLRPVDLDEAVGMLQPCAKALSARYGAPVAIEAGVVGPHPSGRGALVSGALDPAVDGDL